MIFVQTPSRVLSRGSLDTRSVPRKTLYHGVFAGPRSTVANKVFWRLVFDFALVRYLMALLPFPLAAILRPELALPLTQAPLLMFAVVYLVEAHVLSIPNPERRRALIDEEEAARGLDILGLRARAILTRIATGRGIAEGTIHLAVEQSELARIAPLTFVSVQIDGPTTGFLDLTDDEIASIEGGLFDDEGLSERLLQRINLSQNVFFRSVALDPRAISAHARLEALIGAS